MQRPDREAIMKAISELDRIGRPAFMERYGFADRNLTYEVEHQGRRYPSKAIFGAAFGFMPGGKPRDSAQCNGTEAREHLKKLGFAIIDARTPVSDATVSDADKIRHYVLARYITPARNAGQLTVDVLVRDVNTALDLNQAWPNICQALAGRKFLAMAQLPPPERIGADQSSATIFRFKLAVDTSNLQCEDQSMSEPTNLILYGPPGTGKTYTTAREALRLCGEDVSLARFPDTEKGRKALMDRYNQLRKDERIGFVTFHQSYAYEDFVEGLRPVPIESEAGPPSGFELKPHDGIFKKMAARAAMTRAGTDGFVLGDRRIFKMSLGYIGDPANDYVFEDAIEQGHIRLGYDPIDFSDDKFADVEEIIAACKAFDLEHPGQNSTPPTGNSGRVQCPKIFRNWMQIGDIVVVPMGNSFFRAIGEITGDYEFDADVSAYVHKRAVRWLWSDPEGKPVEEIYDKKFTMQSVYALGKDLIKPEGLARFINSNSVPSDAPLLPHVLIIDEINRGNVSKIFGELITLIEPDKRAGMTNALTVTLPYSPGDFTVPANLHIIGTMNTADRSIALLDTALRRRFTFREIAPDPSLLGTVGAVDLKALLTTINNRIEYLIDREHRIGHAFFMGCTDRAGVDGVMRDKVIPLLQEYFFEDWSRVRAVLGRGFIGKISLKRPPGIEDYHPETKDSWFVRWNKDENGKEAVYPYGFPDDAYNLLLGQPASDAGPQNQGE